jgi:hypothetical protein
VFAEIEMVQTVVRTLNSSSKELGLHVHHKSKLGRGEMGEDEMIIILTTERPLSSQIPKSSQLQQSQFRYV